MGGGIYMNFKVMEQTIHGPIREGGGDDLFLDLCLEEFKN
jgi:hypothetical protein